MADHKSSAYVISFGGISVSENCNIFQSKSQWGCARWAVWGWGGGDQLHMLAFDQEDEDHVWIRDATVLSASQSPAFPSKPLPGVTLHVHSQPHGRDWHHEAGVFRSCWHICFSLPHRGRERPSLWNVNRPSLGKRRECVYLSFTTLGPEKGRFVHFTRAIPSLCISGPLPFEWID